MIKYTHNYYKEIMKDKYKYNFNDYKDRFSNKNELFNFKQVLRGDNKLSMKIFTRGMDALNLEFVIIIREKSTNDIVGDKLDEDIEISSEETYPL